MYLYSMCFLLLLCFIWYILVMLTQFCAITGFMDTCQCKNSCPSAPALWAINWNWNHRRQRRRGCRGRDPPPIFDLQGSSCVDDPPILWQVFYFFPSAELLNTASRCHFHLQCAQCTVFNSTVEQNSLRMTTCLLATSGCTISYRFEMKNS